MQAEKTFIDGLLILSPDIFADDRGSFRVTFHLDQYSIMGLDKPFLQDNVSVSRKGVFRGLHYQVPPMEQGKLVQVLAGSVIDVAVDIRFGSPTFGKHVAVELSAENGKQFWVPPGFAHGFVSLEDGTVFHYKCTGYYSKEHERGVRFSDPVLDLDLSGVQPLVNERDATFPLLKDISEDFTFQPSTKSL